MSCRWNRETERYEVDGDPCRTDEHGDPTRHCTARTSCSVHVGPGEITCARCIGRVRQDMRVVRDYAALLPPQALAVGVESTAANLAGPTADPRGFSEGRIRRNRRLEYAYRVDRTITEREYDRAWAAEYDDDDEHPENVLGWFVMAFAEDYGHDLPARLTLAVSTDYLDRNLGRIAQDPRQDFTRFAEEVRSCRNRVELAIRAHRHRERGAPCPACIEQRADGRGPRLTRHFGHWCTEEECERLHYLDESGDEWVCKDNRDHRWSDADYRRWVVDAYTERRDSA